MNNNNNLPVAALATSPSPAVSGQYNFFPTTTIVEALLERGFVVAGSSQYRTKDASNTPFARHTVRFRPPKTELYQVGDLIPEITIQNAHRAGALVGHAGAFTCFCLNQCIKPIPFMHNECYFRHSKRHSIEDVIEGVYSVVERSNRWVKQLTEWNRIPISSAEAEEMAEQALLLRWPQGNSPVTIAQALAPRYREESSQTLGAVYNRLHNLAQHGLPKVGKGRVARALRNDSFLKFNQGLVEIVEGFVV